METFRRPRLAHPRCVGEPSSTSAGQYREVPNTFSTRGERTVFIRHPDRQAHTAPTALAGAGETGGRFGRCVKPLRHDWEHLCSVFRTESIFLLTRGNSLFIVRRNPGGKRELFWEEPKGSLRISLVSISRTDWVRFVSVRVSGFGDVM